MCDLVSGWQGDPVIGEEILKRYFAMDSEYDYTIGLSVDLHKRALS